MHLDRLRGIHPFKVGLSVVITALVATHVEAGTLEDDFLNPPVAARPYVWWHWMGGNFSKEGITKDLEAMKASGIGGATIFNLSSAVQESHAPTLNNPWPDQTYHSPKYWEAIHHAAAEAERLGLEIGLHNTVGYSTTGGPWIDEERSMQRLVWSQVVVRGGEPVVTHLPAPALVADEGWGKTGRKISFYRDVAVLAVPKEKTNLALTEVLDLTSHSKNGELRWNPPSGEWTVYRIGHASTGRPPHPVPDDLLGKVLEADKMSVTQTRLHWAAVMDPLKEHLGPLMGKSFRHFLIDSYEAGSQNWTPGFREEFERRKGYDLMPWLVTMGATVQNGGKDAALRTVGSAEQTSRFEWDYRDVIATLFYENGWQPAVEMIHAAGATAQWEAYGGPFDTIEGSALADLPMTEFWTGRVGAANPAVVGAAQAAGRRVVGAEAFTGRPEVSKWTETPAFLKMAGDAQFATGVNRMILHHWVHQPFDERYQPGMGMGWWGTHFGRNQTWFEPGKEFFRYLGRVQALLQRGEAPADFVSVGTVQGDGDVIPLRALKEVNVRDGKIHLPSGREYAFISFPHDGALLPETVRQIQRLLADGATVVSAMPKKSPSLANYPKGDEEIHQLAKELWGDDKEAIRQTGRGRLFTRGDIGVAMRELGIKPIAQVAAPLTDGIRISARQDGETHLFFVANLKPEPAAITASFRVTGMQPELWDAETGSMELAPLWRENGTHTEVEISLGSAKSVFVIFRSPLAAADHLAAIEAEGEWKLTGTATGPPVISARTNVSGTAVFASGKRAAFELKPAAAVPVTGPWTVDLSPAVGEPGKIELPELESLSESADPAVKYFSGTATYRTTVEVEPDWIGSGKRIELDLGDVRDLATVRVNGEPIGVIWHAPFVRDITRALKPGQNTLEIAVANTWHNRLVGDEQFPPDFEIGLDRGADMGRAITAYPDWFVKNLPRPEKNRLAFVNWFYHRSDTPLLPSGLLGPIRLIPNASMVLTP
jgi:hypothetical protein